MPQLNPRVVILGAGFGGLEATKALGRAPVEITLIDRQNCRLRANKRKGLKCYRARRRLRANKRKGLRFYRVRLTAGEVAAMNREGVAKDFTPAGVQAGIEAIVAEWLNARTIAH